LGVVLLSTGKAQPELVVDNGKMEELVDTNSQWIVERTGIKTRRIAVKETGLELAVRASEEAFAAGGIDKDSIGLVIVATITPDALVPSMASLVKRELGLENAIAFDINAACSGFIYSLWNAEALMKANGIKRALVIGVERLTRVTDWEDRGTCILFGDGAGCSVLELSDDKAGIISSYIKNYDDESDALTCGMNYPATPFSEAWVQNPYIVMNGAPVFRFAVGAIGEVMDAVLQKAGIDADDVKYYVPHQANMRIIKAAAQRVNQPLEKFQINIQDSGNASAASIPMALADLMDSGKVSPGDIIMLMGFGGGLTAGAILIEA